MITFGERRDTFVAFWIVDLTSLVQSFFKTKTSNIWGDKSTYLSVATDDVRRPQNGVKLFFWLKEVAALLQGVPRAFSVPEHLGEGKNSDLGSHGEVGNEKMIGLHFWKLLFSL